MHIEFLYTTDCDVAATMLPRVRQALGREASLDLVDLHKTHPNDPHRCYRSGTVLVDGADLFGIAPNPKPHQVLS